MFVAPDLKVRYPAKMLVRVKQDLPLTMHVLIQITLMVVTFQHNIVANLTVKALQKRYV